MLARNFPAGHKVRVSKECKRRLDIRDVFSLYSQGFSDSDIEAQLQIAKKALLKAKAAIVAIDPRSAAAFFGKPGGDARILVDENLPTHVIMELYPLFGVATHTRYTALSGQSDYVVYDYARQNGMTMIVSHDKHERQEYDLTVIAMARALDWVVPICRGISPADLPLPLLVRLQTKDQASALLPQYAAQVREMMRNPLSPYITLFENKVRIGPTYEQIMRSLMFQPFPQTSGERSAWAISLIKSHGGAVLALDAGSDKKPPSWHESRYPAPRPASYADRQFVPV